MRRKMSALAAAGVLALGGGLAATTPVVAVAKAPQAQAACKRAKIGGQSRCIARGQFCARRYQRDYLRYGYSCSKRDARGNWHLV